MPVPAKPVRALSLLAGSTLLALLMNSPAHANEPSCGGDLIVLQHSSDTSNLLVSVPREMSQLGLPSSAFTAIQSTGPVAVQASRVASSEVGVRIVLSASPTTTAASFDAARSAVHELLIDLPAEALVSVQIGEQAATPPASTRTRALTALAGARVPQAQGVTATEISAAVTGLPSTGHVVLFTDHAADGSLAQRQAAGAALASAGLLVDRVKYGLPAAAAVPCELAALVSQVDQVQSRIVGQYRLTLSGASPRQATELSVGYGAKRVSTLLPASSPNAAAVQRAPSSEKSTRRSFLLLALGALLAVVLLGVLAALVLRLRKRRRNAPAGPVPRPVPGAGLYGKDQDPVSEPVEPVPTLPASDYPHVDVAIVMESTYPFLKGGVSAVVHDIVMGNRDLTFGIIHLTWDRHSAKKDLYGIPSNVLWVKTVYLSMSEHRENFIALRAKDLQMRPAQRAGLAGRLFAGLGALLEGDVDPLWSLYDDGINPRTRDYNVFALLGSKEFMSAARDHLAGLGMSLTDMFWLLREFFSLTSAVLDQDYPAAGVYHAHTTGYATLLGAAAARQNGGELLLTEHNLYVRDTVNTQLDRSMHLPVTLADWRTFDVPPHDRAWMAWWIQMGVFCYPSAAMLTYLYPSALVEAADLGSPIERSVIIPNGMVVREFDEVYQQRLTAGAQLRDDPDHIWKLVFIARVVPIKGLADLVDSVALLRDRGITNFHVDVLGPTDHSPDYYRLCRDKMRKVGVEDLMTFCGTVKVRDLLGGYDLLVMSSYNEGQPIVTLEAMAAGIPTVSTEVGGLAQLVDDPLTTPAGRTWGPAGLLTRPGDAVQMADGLQTLMWDRALYAEYAANARGRLVGFFQLEDAMGAYNRLYRELGGLPVAALEPSSLEVVDLRDLRDVNLTDRTTRGEVFATEEERRSE